MNYLEYRVYYEELTRLDNNRNLDLFRVYLTLRPCLGKRPQYVFTQVQLALGVGNGHFEPFKTRAGRVVGLAQFDYVGFLSLKTDSCH